MKPRTLNEILIEAMSHTAPELQFEVMRRTLKPYLDLLIVGPGGAQWLLDGTVEELGRGVRDMHAVACAAYRSKHKGIVWEKVWQAVVLTVLAHLKVEVLDDETGDVDVIEGEYSADSCEVPQESGSFFIDLDPEKYGGERVRIRISKVAN